MSHTVKEIDNRECVKVVTHNKFITAQGLPELSLKARKLLYLAVGQARLNDTEFYTYEITPKEFAEIMGIASTHVYQEALAITAELASTKISFIPEGKKKFKHIPVTAMCEYDESSVLRIEINPRMAELILGLEKDFSQPNLNDFMKMKSPYSMAVWHLMQQNMLSRKPGITNIMQFDLSLDTLREVTGTQEKFKQVGQFKEKVFDKAIREIEVNCEIKVFYENIKKGRTVVGFRCSAVSEFHIDENSISQKVKDRTRLGKLRIESNKRELTLKEQEEYELLTMEQMELKF